MRCSGSKLMLALVILLIAISGCRSAYSGLETISVKDDCLANIRVHFNNELYKAQVDVMGRSLSGLLLIKEMPDSSTRVVFTTETGVSFFDFAFMGNGDFKVVNILERLNKKPVVRALRDDFELLLMKNTGKIPVESRRNATYFYHRFEKKKKQAWYLTDTQCQQLMGAELASKRKPLVKVEYINLGAKNSPDSIFINHLNFTFRIALKKLDR